VTDGQVGEEHGQRVDRTLLAILIVSPMYAFHVPSLYEPRHAALVLHAMLTLHVHNTGPGAVGSPC
jgi:hypothetical protein